MSEFLIRSLAAACVPHLAAKVEAAVLATVRDELPATLRHVLHEMYAGETLRLYVPKISNSDKVTRDAAIRAAWTGRNGPALAAQFGLSVKQIQRIATGNG